MFVVTTVKVSSRSSPHAVAGALVGIIRDAGAVEIQVIGAGALNQAVKSIAIARNFLAAGGQDASCRPTFASIDIDGQPRTAIRLLVEADDPRLSPAGHPAGDGVADLASSGITSDEDAATATTTARLGPVPVVPG